MTKKPGTRAKRAMMSSVSPLVINSRARSSDMFSNRRTAIEGRSTMSGGCASAVLPLVASPASATTGRCFSWTLPTKRKPFRADVRISRCSLPLSSIAFRAALIRLVRVDFRDYSPTPYGRDEIIFADHASPVFNQVNQKIEDLRLNRHRRAIRTQLPALAVERKIIEQKQHVAPPQSGCLIIPAGRLKRNQDFLKDKSSGAQSLSCGKGAFQRPANEWSVECKRRVSIAEPGRWATSIAGTRKCLAGAP